MLPLRTPLNETILRLGYGGLIPFLALPVLMWLVRADLQPFVAICLTGYAALVISFLGGLHWGIGFKLGDAAPQLHFYWGVASTLLAWVAVLMPAYAGLPLLALLLLGCYLVDRQTWPAAGLAAWLTWRFRLTVVAAISCLLGAAGT